MMVANQVLQQIIRGMYISSIYEIHRVLRSGASLTRLACVRSLAKMLDDLGRNCGTHEYAGQTALSLGARKTRAALV